LVNITGSVVENPEHWNKPVRVSVCPCDVRSRSSDAVNIEADPSSSFAR